MARTLSWDLRVWSISMDDDIISGFKKLEQMVEYLKNIDDLNENRIDRIQCKI